MSYRAIYPSHSFSPYIELKNINELLHGEAVTLDCLFSTCLAFNLNFINKNKSFYVNLCKKKGVFIDVKSNISEKF